MSNYLPYGRSHILEPARKVFKQLIIDGRCNVNSSYNARAPEKRVFYINVGAIPPDQVEEFMANN